MRRLLALIPALLLLAGCGGDAINKDAYNTFLDADDLIRMTDQMAASLASNQQVADTLHRGGGPMVIVLQPIVNDTNEIIPGNEKQLYVHRVEAQLSNKPALHNSFVWVLNRHDYETLKSAEGISDSQLGPVAADVPGPGRLVPQYALTGRFYALTKASAQQRSDYYLCTFRLQDIATGADVWTGTYETKKLAKKGLLD